MAHRRDIGPYVFEVDAERVHCAAMTAIIFDLAAAMPTRFDRRPHPPEGSRLPLREIQQAVVRRIEAPRYRQAAFHFDGYGMPELHSALHQMRPDQDIPARQVVDEQRAARFQDADALAQPEFAPIEIFSVSARIVRPASINLPEIERRIGKNRVYDPGWQTGQYIEAVALEQHASRGGVMWSREVPRGDGRAE